MGCWWDPNATPHHGKTMVIVTQNHGDSNPVTRVMGDSISRVMGDPVTIVTLVMVMVTHGDPVTMVTL